MEMQIHDQAPDMSGFALPQNWHETVDIAAVTPVDYLDAPATPEQSAADLSVYAPETMSRQQAIKNIGDAALDPYARFETAAMRDAKAEVEADRVASDQATERKLNEMHFLNYMADIARQAMANVIANPEEEKKTSKKTVSATGTLALVGASK